MAHHEQAVVTGFVLAQDCNAQQYRTERGLAERAARYSAERALAAWRRLVADSLVADWPEVPPER